ncbi:MAG: hypothetical protein EF812_05830 [Methanosarcinales archaeon]|nr:MAG: hypothetical protein EF812_05830 [Methanosarcinales archaeon]
MIEKEKRFKIYGEVGEIESKLGVPGLLVEALDKDYKYDDQLGSAITDKDGNFEIKYEGKNFKDSYLDKQPDIYLRIKRPDGTVIHTTEDKVRYRAGATEEFVVNISKDLIEKAVEEERREFEHLIVKNPNYFGNVADEAIAAEYKPVCLMKNKTKYEELRCVGLYPEDNLLEAVIEVKLPYGYKGRLCDSGSKEYVTFYIDYGAGFVSVGTPAEVNVHDMLFVNGGHLFYAVCNPFIPEEYLKCDTPQVVKVRAILSWGAVPTGYNYVPVWGNVVDEWVQIKPKSTYSGPIVELIKPLPEAEIMPLGLIPPEKFMIMGDKKEIKELIDKSIEAEEKIKEEGKVEEERFEFKKLIMHNPNYFGSITESKDKDEIMKAVYKLPPKTVEALLPKLAIDPGMLVPIKPILYNTKYEELKCVGLYPEDDLLEAVIEVKLPYGFNGDLCDLGSKQYVSFYIDWGDSTGYQHVATSTVKAHDIPDVKTKHLFYAVKARIPNIESKLEACKINNIVNENIVKVRAILSWNEDPTPFGHTHTPTWGNVLTRNIQIRPKDEVRCDIRIVNGVIVDQISQSGSDEGLAVKEGSASPIYDRPFGGIIACRGNVNIVNAKYYRFLYSEDDGASWIPIKNKRYTANPFWPWWGSPSVSRTPDTDGWFDKGTYISDKGYYEDTALVHWRSYGKNDKYKLKLEVAKADKTLLCEDEVSVMLDNSGLELLSFGGSSLPTSGVTVKDSSGNYKKCDTFVGSEDINIFGNFRDDYFSSFGLKVFGGNIAASGHPIPGGTGSYDPGIPGIINGNGIVGASNGGIGGKIGTLDLCTIPQTGGKIKCAYGIELHIRDRAIVGYLKNGYEFWKYNHRKDAFVTFDWDPTGCPP